MKVATFGCQFLWRRTTSSRCYQQDCWWPTGAICRTNWRPLQPPLSSDWPIWRCACAKWCKRRRPIQSWQKRPEPRKTTNRNGKMEWERQRLIRYHRQETPLNVGQFRPSSLWPTNFGYRNKTHYQVQQRCWRRHCRNDSTYSTIRQSGVTIAKTEWKILRARPRRKWSIHSRGTILNNSQWDTAIS